MHFWVSMVVGLYISLVLTVVRERFIRYIQIVRNQIPLISDILTHRLTCFNNLTHFKLFLLTNRRIKVYPTETVLSQLMHSRNIHIKNRGDDRHKRPVTPIMRRKLDCKLCSILTAVCFNMFRLFSSLNQLNVH